jgi:hypothetical protein
MEVGAFLCLTQYKGTCSAGNWAPIARFELSSLSAPPGVAQVSLARNVPREDHQSLPPFLADVCHGRAAQFIRRKIPPLDAGHLDGGGSPTSPSVASASSRSLARAE